MSIVWCLIGIPKSWLVRDIIWQGLAWSKIIHLHCIAIVMQCTRWFMLSKCKRMHCIVEKWRSCQWRNFSSLGCIYIDTHCIGMYEYMSWNGILTCPASYSVGVLPSQVKVMYKHWKVKLIKIVTFNSEVNLCHNYWKFNPLTFALKCQKSAGEFSFIQLINVHGRKCVKYLIQN